MRALQEREIDPVGSDKSIPIDVRVIAASNIPLENLVNEGMFRSDLYYRLNVVNIHAPALRERMEDIPLLTDYFIQRYNDQLGMVLQGITSDALNLLMSYDWPGNIRELQNAVESAMNVAEGSVCIKRISTSWNIVSADGAGAPTDRGIFSCGRRSRPLKRP